MATFEDDLMILVQIEYRPNHAATKRFFQLSTPALAKIELHGPWSPNRVSNIDYPPHYPTTILPLPHHPTTPPPHPTPPSNIEFDTPVHDPWIHFPSAACPRSMDTPVHDPWISTHTNLAAIHFPPAARCNGNPIPVIAKTTSAAKWSPPSWHEDQQLEKCQEHL